MALTTEFGSAVVADQDQLAVLAETAGLKRLHFFQRNGLRWDPLSLNVAAEALEFGSKIVLDKWLVVVEPHSNGAARIHVYDWADPEAEAANFLVSPPSGVENVGISVATYGDRILVGSRGAVWVFEYDGSWEESAFISPPGHFEGFGVAVDLFGERLVVGEVDPDSLNGRVFEYTFNGGGWDRGWVLETPGAGEDGFGLSVSLYGDRVLVGAPEYRHSSDATGTVWLFDLCSGDAHGPQCEFSCTDGARNGYEGAVDCGGWCKRCEEGAACTSDSHCASGSCVGPGVCAPDTVQEIPVGDFGVSEGGVEIALHNRMAAVAHSNFSEENIVSTYTFDGEAWYPFDTLSETSGGFGSDVAVSDGLLVVGSRNSDHSEMIAAGTVKVYRATRSGWGPSMVLNQEEPVAGANLGVMVDVDPPYIVASAPGVDSVLSFRDNGATFEPDHVFENVADGAIGLSLPWLVTTTFNPDGDRARVFELDEDGWDGGTTLPIPGSPDNSFGEAVAVAGDWIAVSAPLEGGSDTDRGTVYMFRYDTEWQFVQTIIPEAGAGSQFGASLWMTEDALAVGAPGFDTSGGTFLYGLEGSKWFHAGTHTVSDTGPGQEWASTVAFSGDWLFTASMRHNTVGQAILFDTCPLDLHGPFCMSSCSDEVKTGEETNIDCGGPCQPCD